MKTRLILLLLLALCPNLLCAAEFRAGAAVGDITPTKWPVYLVGSFSERGAQKAWDPLAARALVLDDGETRLAIVIVDSCLIPRSPSAATHRHPRHKQETQARARRTPQKKCCDRRLVFLADA